jgi:hypothetical protein
MVGIRAGCYTPLGKIVMLNRKTDLDTLIEQTMAIANSIHVEPLTPRLAVEPDRIPPVNKTGSDREEIGRRIASFKAHQQRFIREREEHVASEFKRMRASR